MSETKQGQWTVDGDYLHHLVAEVERLQAQLAEAEKAMHVLAGGLAEEREKVRDLQTKLAAANERAAAFQHAMISNGGAWGETQTELQNERQRADQLEAELAKATERAEAAEQELKAWFAADKDVITVLKSQLLSQDAELALLRPRATLHQAHYAVCEGCSKP